MLYSSKSTDHVIVLSVTRLLVSSGKDILLVDRRTGTVLDLIRLQNDPQQICWIGDNKLAAALKNNESTFSRGPKQPMIKIIKIDQNSLHSYGDIDFKYNIKGIARHGNNNLVTSFDYPAGVEIMSTGGAVIHRLDNKVAGQELFMNPSCLTTSPDGSVFVFDSESWSSPTYKVIKLDSCLNIQQTISSPLLESLRGLFAINNDQLLFCNEKSVVLIRPSTSDITVLLGEKQGIKNPTSIALCKTQKTLFVATREPYEVVMVYKQT